MDDKKSIVNKIQKDKKTKIKMTLPVSEVEALIQTADANLVPHSLVNDYVYFYSPNNDKDFCIKIDAEQEKVIAVFDGDQKPLSANPRELLHNLIRA